MRPASWENAQQMEGVHAESYMIIIDFPKASLKTFVIVIIIAVASIGEKQRNRDC